VSLEEVAQTKLAEYDTLKQAGDVYAAFVKLSEVCNWLEGTAPSDPEISQRYLERCNSPLARSEKENLQRGIERRISTLAKIMDVGTRFTFEEVLLLITFATELELLKSFLRARRLPISAETASVESKLLALSERHPQLFRSAQATARRNWGIPLRSHWLGAP
jgi:hypothetical protein